MNWVETLPNCKPYRGYTFFAEYLEANKLLSCITEREIKPFDRGHAFVIFHCRNANHHKGSFFMKTAMKCNSMAIITYTASYKWIDWDQICRCCWAGANKSIIRKQILAFDISLTTNVGELNLEKETVYFVYFLYGAWGMIKTRVVCVKHHYYVGY